MQNCFNYFSVAIDTGGKSAHSLALSYPDLIRTPCRPAPVQPTWTRRQRTQNEVGDDDALASGDDSVSAGTMFFAHNNDSLVMPSEKTRSQHVKPSTWITLTPTRHTTSQTLRRKSLDLLINIIRPVAVPKRLVAHRSQQVFAAD